MIVFKHYPFHDVFFGSKSVFLTFPINDIYLDELLVARFLIFKSQRYLRWYEMTFPWKKVDCMAERQNCLIGHVASFELIIWYPWTFLRKIPIFWLRNVKRSTCNFSANYKPFRNPNPITMQMTNSSKLLRNG